MGVSRWLLLFLRQEQWKSVSFFHAERKKMSFVIFLFFSSWIFSLIILQQSNNMLSFSQQEMPLVLPVKGDRRRGVHEAAGA